MDVLEKIFEEIEDHAIEFESFGVCDDYVGVGWVKEIIRSYMDEARDTNVPSNDEIEPVSEEFLKDCAETAKKYNRENNGWIPVEEGLPEEEQKVLVWYEYFRYGEYNRMFKTYGIGWQFDGYWSGDVSGTKARCIAWQPLPEPYRPKGIPRAKNTQQEMEDFWRDK